MGYVRFVVLLSLGLFVGCRPQIAGTCPSAPRSQAEFDRLVEEIDGFLKGRCNDCKTPQTDTLCARVCVKLGKNPIAGPMPWEIGKR